MTCCSEYQVGDGADKVTDYLTIMRESIGRQLLTDCVEAYKGIYQYHLLTDQTPKTKAFYESLGFVTVASLACQAYTYGT